MLSGEAADDHIRSAFEIASYLRKNVVQGIKTEEEGVYGESYLLVTCFGWLPPRFLAIRLLISLTSPSPLAPPCLLHHITSPARSVHHLVLHIVHTALRFTEETERGDNDSIKQPPESEAREMRPPRQGNEGVKRRRRVVTAASADV